MADRLFIGEDEVLVGIDESIYKISKHADILAGMMANPAVRDHAIRIARENNHDLAKPDNIFNNEAFWNQGIKCDECGYSSIFVNNPSCGYMAGRVDIASVFIDSTHDNAKYVARSHCNLYDAIFLALKEHGMLEKYFLCNGNLKGFRQDTDIKSGTDLEMVVKEYESSKNQQ